MRIPVPSLLPGLQGKTKTLFWLLFLENFAFNAAHNSLNLLPPYLAELGAGKTFLGIFGTLNTLVLLGFLVLAPGFVAKLRRVRALAAGFALLLGANLLVFLFPESLGWITACRLPGTLSYVFSYTLLMAMVYDICPAGFRTGTIALFGVSGLISNPVSSLMGEFVVARWHEPALFLLSAFFALVALGGLVLIARLEGLAGLLPESNPAGAGAGAGAGTGIGAGPKAGGGTGDYILGIPKALLRNGKLRHLAVSGFVFGAAFPAWMTFIPLLIRHNPTAVQNMQLTSFTLPFAVVSVSLRLGWSAKLDKAKPATLLAFAFGTLTLAFGLMVLPLHPASLWIAGALYGISHSVLFPVLSSLHVKAGGEDNKAAWNNAFILESSLGAITVVPLAGLVGDYFGYGALFACLWGINLACLASLLVAARLAARKGQSAIVPRA